MNIGKAQILTCPHCGGIKEVMSLISGNTFECKCWSDTKTEARMLPQVSYIQKCPACGKYYFIHKQEYVQGDSYSEELGTLTFEECLEALLQLQEEGFDEEKYEEYNTRVMLVLAYNDKYYRKDENASVSPTDFKAFKSNIISLLELFDYKWNPLFAAELYREIGEFSKCEAILESTTELEEGLENIKNGILEHSKQKDNKVFCYLNTSYNHE